MSPLQVSVEQDGSVELQSVTAAFPGATSIKYRNPAGRHPAGAEHLRELPIKTRK